MKTWQMFTNHLATLKDSGLQLLTHVSISLTDENTTTSTTSTTTKQGPTEAPRKDKHAHNDYIIFDVVFVYSIVKVYISE